MPDHETHVLRETTEAGAGWAVWLAWGWVVVVLLATVAVVTGWDDLRLALDFQRHFGGP